VEVVKSIASPTEKTVRGSSCSPKEREEETLQKRRGSDIIAHFTSTKNKII